MISLHSIVNIHTNSRMHTQCIPTARTNSSNLLGTEKTCGWTYSPPHNKKPLSPPYILFQYIPFISIKTYPNFHDAGQMATVSLFCFHHHVTLVNLHFPSLTLPLQPMTSFGLPLQLTFI